MPVLPLTRDEYLAPNMMTLARIGAVMLWPDRPQKWQERERGIIDRAARLTLDELPRDRQASVGGLLDLSALAAGAMPLEDIEEEDAARFDHGRIVGSVLTQAFAQRDTAPIGGNLQEAKRRVARMEKISVARIDKADIWRRFNPVAHLWAARTLMYTAGISSPRPFPVPPLAHFQEFVSLAAAILKAGAERSKQSSYAYIDQAECLLISADIPVARGQVRFCREDRSTE